MKFGLSNILHFIKYFCIFLFTKMVTIYRYNVLIFLIAYLKKYAAKKLDKSWTKEENLAKAILLALPASS